jgi:hypothetical protein
MYPALINCDTLCFDQFTDMCTEIDISLTSEMCWLTGLIISRTDGTGQFVNCTGILVNPRNWRDHPSGLASYIVFFMSLIANVIKFCKYQKQTQNRHMDDTNMLSVVYLNLGFLGNKEFRDKNSRLPDAQTSDPINLVMLLLNLGNTEITCSPARELVLVSFIGYCRIEYKYYMSQEFLLL